MLPQECVKSREGMRRAHSGCRGESGPEGTQLWVAVSGSEEGEEVWALALGWREEKG